MGEKRGSDAHEPLCRVLWAEPVPNKALEPTANRVRCAPTGGGGSPPALAAGLLHLPHRIIHRHLFDDA
jgi:hypothetical protein